MIEKIMSDIAAKYRTSVSEFRGYIKIEEPDVSPLGLTGQRGIGGFYEMAIVDRKIGDVPKDLYLWNEAYGHEYIFLGSDGSSMAIWRLRKVSMGHIREMAINELL